jgi:hypothetical protein
MHIAIVMSVIVTNSVDDSLWLLRCSAIIQVDKGLAVDLLMQHWEVGANALDVQGLR